MNEYDAIIVGAGPNGLTAAARLASRAWRVLVLEQAPTIGGGARTEPFGTGPAVYDVCSAAHPFGAFSTAFAALGLERYGLGWCHSPLPLAHPFDDGSAAVLQRAVAPTAAGFGLDCTPYLELVEPLLARWPALARGLLEPLLRVPPHPFVMARFGVRGLWSAESLVRRFREPATRGLFAGLAAHSYLPLNRLFTGGIGLSLALAAHAVGWPVAGGGSQAISDALAAVIRAHGGEIVTGHDVQGLHELPPVRAILLDVGPRQFVALAGSRLPSSRARVLERWRYGPAAFKADYLLSGPLPWTNEQCRQAGTVHLGGRFEEIASAERATASGTMADRPFMLVVQPSVADPSRAPAGQHVVWAYCHVPHGDGADRSPQLEGQLDRYAPGWRDLVVERRVRTALEFETYNPNDVGGDIAGGSLGGTQLVLRPWAPLHPYRTPIKGVWLCSASTPPGAGAHGMCGWNAAGDVLDVGG